MKPKRSKQENPQPNLFLSELINMINPSHSLVKLSKIIDWDKFDEVFGNSYCSDNCRPAISTRLMVTLH